MWKRVLKPAPMKPIPRGMYEKTRRREDQKTSRKENCRGREAGREEGWSSPPLRARPRDRAPCRTVRESDTLGAISPLVADLPLLRAVPGLWATCEMVKRVRRLSNAGRGFPLAGVSVVRPFRRLVLTFATIAALRPMAGAKRRDGLGGGLMPNVM